MKPTKEQWEEIKIRLSNPYGVRFFLCDGYLVSATCFVEKMRLSIAVCVDGHISGINHWVGKESNMGEMSEISRKFLAITKKYPDQKSVKISEKIFGKKECKKKGLYEATVSTAPFFKTAEGFIAHLKRQNESIEVLDYEDYRSRLAQKMETPDAAQ